jgi:hypothetical protein
MLAAVGKLVQAFNRFPDGQIQQDVVRTDNALVGRRRLGHKAGRFLREGVDLLDPRHEAGHQRVVQRRTHPGYIGVYQVIGSLRHVLHIANHSANA